jgi:cell wall-associated NlpC family hydrolase
MPTATLRARLGITAATVIAGLSIAATPALAGSPIGPANPPAFGQANPTAPVSLQVNGTASGTASHEARIIRRHNEKVRKVLRVARRQKGKPYIYGDAGPHGFDCSGLVRYVFLHAVHRSLPHNAAEQYHSLRHIRRRDLQRGDLVFVDNGGYVSHVGIYDGHDHWWVAPHTGTRVQRQRIYRAHLVYARVLVYHKHLHHQSRKH